MLKDWFASFLKAFLTEKEGEEKIKQALKMDLIKCLLHAAFDHSNHHQKYTAFKMGSA